MAKVELTGYPETLFQLQAGVSPRPKTLILRNLDAWSGQAQTGRKTLANFRTASKLATSAIKWYFIHLQTNFQYLIGSGADFRASPNHSDTHAPPQRPSAAEEQSDPWKSEALRLPHPQ